ncbi:MAG: DUF1015 domain-containing protein [Desulfuromonadales bacterium]|nr:DUF1015 domain-containing protein [Desulfuromonadales bacterium]
MAKIVPFRALRYQPEKVGDLAAVLAPPYDVISLQQQDDLYQRNPFNLIRLILGKTLATDSDTDNCYSRAAADFNAWQKQGVLVRDSEPCLYLYDQTYSTEDGSTVTRKGFIALTRLEDFTSSVVKPHEKTLTRLKTDRLLLTRACQANFSPIFSLYADPSFALETLGQQFKKISPAVAVTDDEGVCHCLWPVDDSSFVNRIKDLLENKPLFIANGHHRYEAALNYRDEMRGVHPDFTGKEPFNYVLMYFANSEDRGISLLPTHRVIHSLRNFSLDPFVRKLTDDFLVSEETINPADNTVLAALRQRLAIAGQNHRTLGLYLGNGRFLFLTLKDEKRMNRLFDPRTPTALRTLDVSILHRLILEQYLGITEPMQEAQNHLRYCKDFIEPFAEIDRGEGQLAFLLNPPRMSELRDVANAGEKLPEKSTNFYPRLLSGLVINPHS